MINNFLQTLTEPQTYKRGKALYKAGKVRVEQHRDGKAIAKVMGTKAYSVVVSYTDGDFFSSCTCPAAEYQTVCKHAVATALTLFGEQAVELDTGGEAVEQACGQGPSLRDWLAGKEVDELVDIALSLIEADPETYDLWWQRAQMAHSPLSAKELKKQITKALPRRSIWEPYKVERYFDRALESLNVLNEGIVQLSADQQMPLLEYAETRLHTVLLNMDDSYGYRLDLEQSLNRWLKACFGRVSWTDKQKGAWLFNRFKAEFTVLAIPEDFGFDPAALEQFYHQCERAIEPGSEPRDKHWIFAQPLLERARKNQDWQQESRLLALIAEKPRDWLELCQLHLDHDDEFTAEDWLLKAKQFASHEKDLNACMRMEIDVRVALDEPSQAWQCAKAWFADNPILEAYIELERYHQQLAPEEPTTEWAEAQMLASFDSLTQSLEKRWASESLVGFYLHIGDLEKAKHQATLVPIDVDLLLELSHRVLAEEPAWAFIRYFRVLEQRIDKTNNRAYHEANAILDDIESRCITPTLRTHFDELIEQLKSQFKQKRNMMALLVARKPN